jgi:Sigma-70, region 4
MSRVDELPPDQRAALSLLLRQRKSYAEVAAMLGIGEQAVRDRAQAALTVLAPRQARALDAEQRREIGEYLLGQQPGVGERLRTRTLLSSSQPARTWAQALAEELRGLAADALPELPAAEPGGEPSRGASPPEPYPLAQAAETTGDWQASSAQPSSRRGGALLLGAILAAAIVVVILVLGGGASQKKAGASASSGASAKAASSAKEEGRFALHAASAGSSSVGAVEVFSESGKRAFFIQAEHLPPTNHFFYAVWLYNSPTSALPLSKSPPVGTSHKLAGAALLPSTAGSYREILLTQETSTRPRRPGHIVLRGSFQLTG